MVVAARKLTFISEAAAHVKILTGGRMVAMARSLAVFIRWAPLDIRRRASYFPGQAWAESKGVLAACRHCTDSEQEPDCT